MASGQDQKSNSYLSGQLLIAMPTMRDPRFSRTVIYMCAHTAEGAMGIVVNRLIGSLSFNDLLQQLGLDGTGSQDARKVHFGGPVETSRGFVLHSADKLEEGSTFTIDPTPAFEMWKDWSIPSQPEALRWYDGRALPPTYRV